MRGGGGGGGGVISFCVGACEWHSPWADILPWLSSLCVSMTQRAVV